MIYQWIALSSLRTTGTWSLVSLKSPGQTIATCQRNIPQHCWVQHVATCWVLLAQVRKWSNLSQQHTTCCKTLQHGGQTLTTCCAQQCCDMSRWHVAIVWPSLYFFENLRGLRSPRVEFFKTLPQVALQPASKKSTIKNWVSPWFCRFFLIKFVSLFNWGSLNRSDCKTSEENTIHSTSFKMS